MPKQMVSIRVEADAWEWLGSYAKARGSSRTAVLEAAIEGLRGDARGGVPDLPDDTRAASSAGRSSGHRTRISASATGAVPARGASRPAGPPPAVMALGGRQNALNEAKERELAKRRRAGQNLGRS